jgi:uncharacterized protein YgiM (DUF1202 family)
MSSSLSRADTQSGPNRRGRGLPISLMVAGLVTLAVLIGGAVLFLSGRLGGTGGAGADQTNNARSYKTLARTQLRAEAKQASRLIGNLREGTIVSGVPAGQQDGVTWVQVTAVDGTRGFVPLTLLKELGPATTSTQFRDGLRRIVTSATVNLRESPSLSGKILGVADGGTRLVSDGMVQSEGENWLRVPIDAQTTVYIMQRFTTADDDVGAGDGFDMNGQAMIGVRGFATQIVNVQATPLEDARIVRALQLGEEVRIIGQTNAGRSWYVLRLTDGSQGFAPLEAVKIDPTASRWVYPDGSVAPGPNIPKGYTTALTPAQIGELRAAAQKARAAASQPSGATKGSSTDAAKTDTAATASAAGEPKSPPTNGPEQLQPKESVPIYGPQ